MAKLWDGDGLRRLRIRKFGGMKAMYLATGISTDVIQNVERGAGWRSSFERYCLAIGVEPSQFELTRKFEIAHPKTVNFRPIHAPRVDTNAWLSHRVCLVSRLDLHCPSSADARVNVRSARLEVPQFTSHGREGSFEWRYWVNLSNWRGLGDADIIGANATWRAEVSYKGEGSTINPFYLSPGESVSHEVMFVGTNVPTWREVLKMIPQLAQTGVDFSLLVTLRMANGQECLEKIHFKALPLFFIETLKDGSKKRYGEWSYLQPPVERSEP